MSIVKLDHGIQILPSHIASAIRVRVPKTHVWYDKAVFVQKTFTTLSFDAILTEIIRAACKLNTCRWMVAKADDEKNYFEVQMLAKPPHCAGAKVCMVAKATYLARRIAMDAQAFHEW